MSDDILNLDDLAPKEITVRIGSQEYKLMEPSEAAASRWRNALLAAAKVGPDGKIVGMGNYADTSVLLVSSCLFKKSKAVDPEGRPQYVPVGVQELKTWPARHMTKLFEKCKELGELNEKPKEKSRSKQGDNGEEDDAGYRAEDERGEEGGSEGNAP